ncbi:hypothetical protein Salat_2765400 [Sesamum alatum]|uniref:Uncharacterized protein n=1 Tax=Sesamum alatum TaxID=300844 RepID=A0AAE1XKL0_9LAMI|nr:hypothetical protein Salat_2765400 [Sesamum alatum]
MQQNKHAKCYCNAYEDLWEQLYILFDRPNNAQDDVIDVDRFYLNVPARQEGWMVFPPPPVIEAPADVPANEAALDAPTNEAVPVDPVHEVRPSELPNEALHDEPVSTATGIPPPVLFIYDSSDSSSSMWKILEEYHASDSSADSILPPPGVPLAMSKRAKIAHPSPPSQKSSGASSSTKSNATPIKKHE